MIWLLLTQMATAQQAGSEASFERDPLLGRPVLDLRLGLGADAPTRPRICGEVAPLAWLSVEGCGNGSGLWHHADIPDMAHFRTRARFAHHEVGRLDVSGLLGVGFTEVEAGRDEGGFRFGAATGPDQVEAAGPEVSAGAKGRVWVDRRAYVVFDATAGVAHIPGAPVVMQRGGPVVPFAALTVGAGF